MTRKTLEETNGKLEASEKQLAALNSERPRVAFSAALPVDGTLGPFNAPYHLVYRHVLSNVGNAYSPISGYFTAPVQGLHYFTFNSFDWSDVKTTGGSLSKNGQQVVSWYYGTSGESSSSNSAILVLQAGDQVNVVVWQDRRISDNGHYYSSFSGFLIFPM
ncbi:hypothetical protein LDENG_00066260 [Lucifuga dentata]|nr:hypothetical protein LDENG_00066260 [Lucifuga dentata]